VDGSDDKCEGQMEQLLIVVLVAGVAAGIVLIAIGLGLGRSKGTDEIAPGQHRNASSGRSFTFSRTFSAGGSTDAKSAEPGIDEATSMIAETIGRIATAAGANPQTTIETHVSRSAIRLDGETPTVEVDGVTYNSLADVPADARTPLLDELRVLLNSNIPDPPRSQLEAFLATADAASETDPSAPT
jgi:hypothetical protein